jgi:hypothetical protein
MEKVEGSTLTDTGHAQDTTGKYTSTTKYERLHVRRHWHAPYLTDFILSSDVTASDGSPLGPPKIN